MKSRIAQLAWWGQHASLFFAKAMRDTMSFLWRSSCIATTALVCLLPLRSHMLAAVHFNEAPAVDIEFGSTDVVAADFNSDGTQDLAVSIGLTAGIGATLILLQNDDGTFANALRFSAPSALRHLTVADLDGDGLLDIAAADERGISVFTGHGDGTFRLTATNRTDASTRWIATGDFNGDGALDLVTASSDTNKLSVLTNNHQGGFAPARQINCLEIPRSVAVGDFNRDGNLDLVTANWRTNSLGLLLGDGAGGFAAPIFIPMELDPPWSTPHLIATGDFDADGLDDLAVVDATASITVLLGRPGNQFVLSSHTAIHADLPSDVEIGDIDGDGRLDLVSVTLANSVNILFGIGDGTFTAAIYGAGDTPGGVAIGDFDGSGRTDIATADFGGTLSLLFQKRERTFGGPEVYPSGFAAAITLVDLNEDGILDVINAEAGTFHFGKGDGTFGSEQSIGPDEIGTVANADFDRDGHIDLAVTEPSQVSVYLGSGTGAFILGSTVGFTNEPYHLLAGDFDGDGHPDLATVNYDRANGLNGGNVLLGHGDGTFSAPVAISFGKTVSGWDTGDFNGDGRTDLVTAHSSDGTVGLASAKPGRWRLSIFDFL